MPAASTPTERWIVVPRWEEFQHRDAARVVVPTWLKTFTRLLSDEQYLTLTGNRRAILHGLWLEYARTCRQLPNDTGTLTRRLNLKVTKADLHALRDAGFIELTTRPPHADDTPTARAHTHGDNPAEPTSEPTDPHNHAGSGPIHASTNASTNAGTSAGTEKRREEQELRAVTSQETPDDDEPDLGTNGTAPGSHIRETVAQSLAATSGTKR